MEKTSKQSSPENLEEDRSIRQALAESAQKQLEQIDPDYSIGWSEIHAIPHPDETIRFGDLPLDIQQGILESLKSSARGESSRWEF